MAIFYCIAYECLKQVLTENVQEYFKLVVFIILNSHLVGVHLMYFCAHIFVISRLGVFGIHHQHVNITLVGVIF